MGHSTRTKSKIKGQAVVEYILLVAVVFIASAVMVSFIRNGIFAKGLSELPDKVSACLSHPTRGGARCD